MRYDSSNGCGCGCGVSAAGLLRTLLRLEDGEAGWFGNSDEGRLPPLPLGFWEDGDSD